MSNVHSRNAISERNQDIGKYYAIKERDITCIFTFKD